MSLRPQSIIDESLEEAGLKAILRVMHLEIVPELASEGGQHSAQLIIKILSRLATRTTDFGIAANGLLARDAEGLPSSSSALLSAVRKESEVRSGYEAAAAALQNREHFPQLRVDRPTDGQLLDCIARHMSDERVLGVENVRVLPGGRSKSTMILDLLSSEGRRELVLRKDFAASITGSSVVDEYPLLQAVQGMRLSAPRPLWIETDPSVLNGACIAFEKIPGSPAGTLFESSAPPQIARDLAMVLAQVHQVDIETLGLAGVLPRSCSANPIREHLDILYARYQAYLPKNTLFDACFDWLYDHVDELKYPTSLVHGDAGFHNVLAHEGRLTALLDWELAHAGDPCEDLAYAKHLVQAVLPWPEFMDVYMSYGGAPVSALRLAFFEVWRPLGLALIAAKAAHYFSHDSDHDIRLAAISIDSLPQHFRYLADALGKAFLSDT